MARIFLKYVASKVGGREAASARAYSVCTGTAYTSTLPPSASASLRLAETLRFDVKQVISNVKPRGLFPVNLVWRRTLPVASSCDVTAHASQRVTLLSLFSKHATFLFGFVALRSLTNVRST